MSATQNTRIVTNEILAEIIKPAHVRKLMRFSRATGYSPSQILNRAVENFMAIEAPVYLTYAKETKGQRV